MASDHFGRYGHDAMAMLQFVQLAITEKGHEAFQASIARQFKTKTLPPNVDESAFAALPSTTGIYVFEDDQGTPLYIGKSVNIRQRVMSHFASDTKVAKEMKLSLTSHCISFVETDTELEALLLESAKIKELQPVHNRLLRRVTKQAVLVRDFNEEGYMTIRVESRDLHKETDFASIYGVYTSVSKAKMRLESLVKTFSLCPKLMHLEKSTGACFRYQLGFCKGACIGKESLELYNRRVDLALERSKLEAWPFKGKIILKLSEAKGLLLDQWIIEGYVTATQDGAVSIDRLENGFDLDTYKIVRSYIKKHPKKLTLFTVSPEIANGPLGAV